MRTIFSFGNFDDMICSWARIRYTVAKGLDPTEFRTIGFSTKMQPNTGFHPFNPPSVGPSSILDKLMTFSRIGGIFALNFTTSWGETCLPTSRLGVGTFTLLQAIKHMKVDLFHATQLPICVPIYHRLLKNNPKMKLVNTFYGFHPVGAYRWAGYILTKKADVVTSVSKTTARQVERYFSTQSRVIYDGVDVNLFHPISHTNARPRILYVGSLTRTRHPEVFLRMSKHFPECDFILKAGHVQPEFEEMLRQKSSNVHVIRRPMTHTELAPIYAHSDIFLFPSTHEGIANVMLEAAASGVPIVVPRATSFWEFVQNGEQGFRCASFQEMIRRIKYLVENKEERLRIGARAREQACNFSWENTITQYQALFRELLE